MRPVQLTLTLALAVTAMPALAETPLSADAFERLVEGRTMTFGLSGQEPYGIERYLPDRRVIWAFIGEACVEGRWYPEEDTICFVYEDGTGPQCWQFYKARDGVEDGLRALFTSDPDNDLEYVVREATIPFVCPGAGV